ncbi:MAG: hypothetical protein ACHP7N_00975 [Caulobacterales bacterium]
METHEAHFEREHNRGGSAGGVTRLINADAAHTLEQLKSSPILEEGKVCLAGLDAIRDQMGARWTARRELVYAHFERTLQRQLGAHGFSIRISDTDYLVAQPNESRLGGQAYCLNCLREVLHHFLGEAQVAQIVVHEVTSVGEGSVEGRKLDVGAVEEAEITERSNRVATSPTPRLISQDRWTPFVAGDGRRLRASCQLEPVFQLKTFGRIGYRMSRRVLQLPGETPLSPADIRKLPSADIEKIDFATLARGLNRLEDEAENARQPSIILPVSFVTLSSQRGRAVLVDFFRAAQASVKQGLICEVCDIEGVPPSTLLTATSLIKPFCLFIVGRLTDVPAGALNAMKDAGLQGLSIECPNGLVSDADFTHFAKSVVVGAKPVAKTVMFYRLLNARQAAIAGLLGATHASLAQPAARAAEPVAGAA